MKCWILVLLALSFTGCATNSGIVPEGPDTYLISRQGGSAFTSSGSLKVAAIREASAFCVKDGKKFMLTSTSELAAGPGRFPEAEVQFMCLNADDPELVRPILVPVPNERIQITR
jgi:hypothetical protein